MRTFFRPTTSLFFTMGLVLAGAALFSSLRIGEGDLPGAHYYVFPFLHHHHGEFPAFFIPGSWAVNFLVPSYLLSVLLNTVRRSPATLAVFGSPFFLYVWLPATAIVEVAGDTLVPLLVTRFAAGLTPLVVLVDAGFIAALLVGHLCAKGSGGEW